MNNLFNKIEGILILFIIGVLVVIAILTITNKISNNNYVYSARGVICEEFDKENNTLKGCDLGDLGKAEIINPISVLKMRIE